MCLRRIQKFSVRCVARLGPIALRFVLVGPALFLARHFLRFPETLSKGHTDASMSRSKRYLVSDTSSDNELVMWSAYCDSLVYRLAPRSGRRGEKSNACTSWLAQADLGGGLRGRQGILRFSPDVSFWANRKRPKSDAKMLKRFYGIPPHQLQCETLFLHGRTSAPEHEDRLVKMLSLMGPSGRPVRVLLTTCPGTLLARPTAECSRTSSTNLWAGQRMFLLSQ